MKKYIKLILAFTVVMVAFTVSEYPCFAVSAGCGGSDSGEYGCHSATAENPVTLEVLAERDRLKEEKAGKNVASGEEGIVAGKTKNETERTLPLLCIVTGFNGVTSDAPQGMPYSEEYDWGEYIFRSESSLTKYYRDMSLGKFTFVPASENSRFGADGNYNKPDRVNDGIVHVTVDQAHPEWWNSQLINNTDTLKLAMEAVSKAASYVDLNEYDADGNGIISNSELAICFILAGYDASLEPKEPSRGSKNYTWPHAFAFRHMEGNVTGFSYPSMNGIKIDDYICMAETMILDEPEQESLSTLCHELGHYLGLPDLYNTVDVADGEWENYSVGMMSLMDKGCWGVNADGEPTVYSLDMWSRYFLGWIDATWITESGTYIVSSDDYSDKTAYPRLYYISGARKGEYYLIENHRMSGWDADMPAGIANQYGLESYSHDGGIVIWHIDQDIIDIYRRYNQVNAVNHRPGVMPIYPEESSQGTFKLISDVRRGLVANDPFYSTQYYKQEFLDLVLPSYGWGKDANARLGRFYTYTHVNVIGSSSDEMQINVTIRSNEWVNENGKWRYLGTGGQYKTGWQLINGKWYYLENNGIMHTGWYNDKGTWYYLTGSGAMKTGWLKSGGKWYFFTGSGAMKTGWLKNGGKWYYLTGSGAMKTGWLKSGGKWYFFTGSGAMKTGWLMISGKWYFLDSCGAMVTGNCTINGKTYSFNTSGECLNP